MTSPNEQAAQCADADEESLRRALHVAAYVTKAKTVAIYECKPESPWKLMAGSSSHPLSESDEIRGLIEHAPVFATEDLREEQGFANHPWTESPHNVRFFAAAELKFEDLEAPRTYLIMTDTERRGWGDEQRQLLLDCSRMTGEVLELQALKASAAAVEERLRREREVRQRLIAELEDSNAKLEQFAYVASHDMQEPLRMVTGFLGLLQEEYGGQLGEDGDEYIAFAVDGAARMKQMINDLLSYSRMRSSTEPFVSVDMQATFGRARQEILKNYSGSYVEIKCSDLPVVSGREEQLFRLFSNLLANCIQHSGTDPRIEIVYEEAPEFFRFAVTDHGVGIPVSQQERIFDIFVSGSRDSSRSGSGMGLAICAAIVKEHSGRLWVESVPGEGATFYFTISRQERP